MTAFHPLLFLPLGVAVMFATALVLRGLRRRRRRSQRLVEQPNSHYTSHLARQRKARHRWHAIDLDRLHEINRDEVVRLLAKVEAIGPDALRQDERVFLDHLAVLAGGAPAEGAGESATDPPSRAA